MCTLNSISRGAVVTTDERRQQRAEILIDLEDTQENFRALQVKASRMADFLDGIAGKLRHNASLRPSGRDFSLDTDLANRLGPNEQSIPDFVTIQRLIEELRTARQKIFNLEQQRSQLGNSGMTVVAG
jgi:hypothetical protein